MESAFTQDVAPVAVTVETEGAIPPEVAAQVVENATEALQDVEQAKAHADEVVEVVEAPAAVEGAAVPTPTQVELRLGLL